MKLACLVLLASILFPLASAANEETPGTRSDATQPGAWLTGGSVSFSRHSGDFYEIDEESLLTFSVQPHLVYFLAPGLGAGVDVGWRRQSQSELSQTSVGIGPTLIYVEDRGSSIMPFIAWTVSYLHLSLADSYFGELYSFETSGYSFRIDGGVFIRKSHVALSIEAGLVHEKYDPDVGASITGTTLDLGVGLAGFFF